MAFFVIGDASGSRKGVAVVEQYGVDYRLGVAHLSMLQALKTLIFSYSLFCDLILIPP